MAKFNLDESNELKKLAEEFERMASAENLREANDAVETEVKEQAARKAGVLPRRTVQMVLGIAAVLVVAIVVFAIIRHSTASGSGYKAVPNVVGDDVAAARDKLIAEGFQISENYDEQSKAAPGKVVGQDIAAGTKITAGGNVTITVAGKAPGVSGKNPWAHPRGSGQGGTTTQLPGNPNPPAITTGNRVTIPKIEGLEAAQARSKLEALGLRVEAKTVNDSTQKPGTVVSCDPRSDTIVDRDTLVRISVTPVPTTPGTSGTVTGATTSSQVTIPDYFGQPSQSVLNDLRAKGLVPAWRMEASSQLRAGYVIRTDPPANTKVDPGSKVTAIISR